MSPARARGRRRGGGLAVALLLPAAALAGCSAELFDGVAPTRLERERAPVVARPPHAYRVVLVSIDGLAPRLLSEGVAPTLLRLAREGRAAVRAETVLPSSTLPSHASMIAGVPPELHRLLWNRYEPWRSFDAPTVFSVCRREGLRCGLVAAKRKLAHLVEGEPGAERYVQRTEAAQVFEEARAYLAERDPDFAMVHVGEVDWSGHADGWGSGAQRAALTRIDGLLGVFLEAVRPLGSGRLALIVTADHGGHHRRHGTDRPEDVRIPWLLWGEGIPAGVVEERVSTLDTAATVLALLGVEPPAGWGGRARFRPGRHNEERP